MADKSSIEWTDATWNPIVGCSIKSPGCANCYAMPMAKRIEAMFAGTTGAPQYRDLTTTVKGKAVFTGKVALAPEHILTQPLRWKRGRKIFVNSMGDLFHENVPDEDIDKVFAVMALTPHHTYQVLTKRAERMREYLTEMTRQEWWKFRLYDRTAANAADLAGWPSGIRPSVYPAWPLPNVWLGVSTERQQEADERIPHLLATPAAVRFISAEPLLGPIDLRRWAPAGRWGVRPAKPDPLHPSESFVPGAPVFISRYYMTKCEHCGWVGSSEFCGGADDDVVCPECHRSICGDDYPALDWVIVGGESGSGARPMHPDWARSLRDQCATANVPFFFKQWGNWKNGSDFACDKSVKAVLRDGRVVDPDLASLQEADRIHQIACQNGTLMRNVGKAQAGRLLDGKEHNEFPIARSEAS